MATCPLKRAKKKKKIKEFEKKVSVDKCTQLFIETPYRNNALLISLLKTCHPATRLCIAYNITSASEWIKTKTIAEWNKNIPELPKEPSIFIIGS